MNLAALFSIVSGSAAGLLALLPLFSKDRRTPQWVFTLGMLALCVEQFLSYYATQVKEPANLSALLLGRFLASSILPGLWLLFAVTYSRVNAMERIKQRFLYLLPCIAIPFSIVTLAPGSLGRYTSGAPSAFDWVILLNWGGFLINAVFLLAMVAALAALERTLRASAGTQRWKIKFMVYGLGTLFAARFFTSSQAILSEQITPDLEVINAIALLFCCLFATRSIARSGSFGIGLYPSQSVLSGSVVLSIAGVYLVLVGILSNIIQRLGGEQAFAVQAFLILVALVGLWMFVQADRTRQLVRKLVSRHFHRPLYDYRSLWLKISHATSQSVREKDICEATIKVVANLFDTKLSSIWLLDTSNKRFYLVASSDLEPRHKFFTASDIPSQFLKNPNPQNIEEGSDPWKELIRKNNPSSFSDGGNRILVPLLGQGSTAGFMLLGDRTNTQKFSQQEFDTLSCIAAHISASLVSAALTRKLEESKEIEAFQTMATFFVHDLKNAVSTLNLMLNNMPLHWNNPEFREDALRGIASTSNRISELISRLSKVRHELAISPIELQLDELVNETLAQWKRPDRIILKLGKIENLTVAADRIKLGSVLLNLLINGSEAIENDGTIELSLTKEGDYARLTVTDDGVGMSSEFLEKSLFRPFRTTKKGGLGIGMFQSKMLVEAHNGTINVHSEEGKGATFSIRIPLSEK